MEYKIESSFFYYCNLMSEWKLVSSVDTYCTYVNLRQLCGGIVVGLCS